MLSVALTGGIASGKTAVSDAFEELGIPVVDADILSREAVAPGSSGLEKIHKRFGNEVITKDGALDRQQLRNIVFNDKASRKDLEAIVHPEVRKLTLAALKKHRNEKAPYCIVVIPLLVETNQQDRYDHIIVVDVSVETQIQRVTERDGSSREQAEKILASQASREQRLAVANDVICNTGSLSDLQAKVEKLHQKLLLLATSKDE